MTTEQKLLNDAAEEINRLRKDNYIMRIKLEMFDKVVSLVHSEPPRTDGREPVSPDILFQIDKHLKENLDALSNAVRESVMKR